MTERSEGIGSTDLLDSPLLRLLVTELKDGDRVKMSELAIARGLHHRGGYCADRPTTGRVDGVSRDRKMVYVVLDGQKTRTPYVCYFWDKVESNEQVSRP